jgi:hypothetical protein
VTMTVRKASTCLKFTAGSRMAHKFVAWIWRCGSLHLLGQENTLRLTF